MIYIIKKIKINNKNKIYIMSNTRQINAAILLQKHTRGFIARKKYKVNHLTNDQQVSYLTFVVGNDPLMPSSLDSHRQSDKKIAIIGTSGMRVVSLACKLGNTRHTPKIILVDNSKEVYEFWYRAREFLSNDNLAATKELFLDNLPSFLRTNQHLFRQLPDDCYASEAPNDTKYLNQNIGIYFSALIRKYGFDYVRSVVCHASLVKQSWADSGTFESLKNILEYLEIDKIYAYPSNILACINSKAERVKIVENLTKLNPCLSIHTDYCSYHGFPENVYLVDSKTPRHVTDNLFHLHEKSEDETLSPLSTTSYGFFVKKIQCALLSNSSDDGDNKKSLQRIKQSFK
jgi:hypothetical protein